MPKPRFDDPTAMKNDRIRRYGRELAALSVLRQKKGEVVVDLVHWMNNQGARLEVAALQAKVADLDDASRRIKIVAVTGVASLIGGAVVTHVFARSAGATFTSFSMARPVATLTTRSVATSAPFRITMGQFTKGQIAKGVLISIPVGMALRKFVGRNALDELRHTAREWSNSTTPPMRAVQRRVEAEASAPAANADVVIKHLLNAPNLIQALSVIDRPQRQEWYRTLRRDVAAMIERDYPDLASHERTALYCRLLWDFLNEARSDFDRMDRQWSDDTRAFEEAITKERSSIERIARRRAG